MDGSATWFSSANFSSALPTSDAVAFYGYTAAANHSYTLSFGASVRDPILHLASLASTLTFPSGTQVTKVSGDPTFAVSSNTVSGAIRSSDSNGTIRLTGTFTSIPFTATKTYMADSKDGILIQIGAPTPPLPRTEISTTPSEPTAGGYFVDRVGILVRGIPSEPQRPVETRCVVDPPTAPSSFNDLPAGCPFLEENQSYTVAGRHTLYAASRDPAGSEETPLRVFPFVVANVPETAIIAAPDAETWSHVLWYEFTGGTNLASVRFECRFDGAAFEPCATPFASAPLPIGPHKFEVRAVGPEGAPDETPASHDVFIRGPEDFPVGDCLAQPIIPWHLLFLGKGWLEDCEISHPAPCPESLTSEECRKYQQRCDAGEVCVRRERRCPSGALCRVTASARWYDADPQTNWQAYALASWDYYGFAGDSAVRRTCRTELDGDRCAVKASSWILGSGKPARARCGLGAGPHFSTGPLGPHYIRRIECDMEVHIESADPLDTATAGTTTQVLVPSSGLIAIGIGLFGAGSSSTPPAATAAAKPRFAPIKREITKRGPVTFKLKPNRAAKRLLRRRGKLQVRLTIMFTPADGTGPIKRRQRATVTRPPSRRELCLARRPAPRCR